MGKIIWRKNFDILRVDYNIACETMPGFGGLSYLTIGKNILSKAIWVIENMDNIGTYFPKEELREIAELTVNKILKDPEHIQKVHKKAAKLNWQYFQLAKKIRKLNIPRLSNSQLATWHDKLFQMQYLSHCWALPTTWWVDSDNEDFSKAMVHFLNARIRQLGLNIEASSAFSTLSTPKTESFATQEEKEKLKLLGWIRTIKKLKHWFMGNTTEQLVKTYPSLPLAWRKKINTHFQKWRWAPYTYVGPAYEIDYYLEVFRGLLHEDLNPTATLREMAAKNKAVQKQRSELIKQLHLNSLERQWFDVAAEMVWLKNFRKEAYYHGFFVLDLLLKEIGIRSGLSLIQAKYLLPRERRKALLGFDFSNIANERIKFSVIYGETPKGKNLTWTDKHLKIFTGEGARKFLKKHKFEKIKIEKTNSLTGSCACPGKAKGTVKIINLPEEMGKMENGDIMLSHTTFPSLVPAMKKASAIVTEDGGITCHAAIVARELQIPCVVGCKNALKIFNDGDVVEVDANKGSITKLS